MFFCPTGFSDTWVNENYEYYNLNYSAEELFPVRREMFFGIKLPVPNQVDAVLMKKYGPDYLTSVPDVSSWLLVENATH